MLVYVWTKTGGGKIIYLYWGNARRLGEMKEENRKYKSEKQTNIKRNWQICVKQYAIRKWYEVCER
jgi:hypothetical protein